jgi:hypothetical protein
MDRQSVNDPGGSGLVLRASEGLPDARIENVAAINDLLDGGVRSERRIVSKYTPIGIVSDQTSIVCRDVLIDYESDRSAERFQHLTLLGDIYAFERVEIGRMNWKKGTNSSTLSFIEP